MIILLFSVLFGVLVVFRSFVAQDSGEFSATLALTGNEALGDHESKAPDLCPGFPVSPPKKPEFSPP